MAKFLLWAIIILGVMLAARLIAHRNARERVAPPPRPSGGAGARDAHSMVRCEHCQIYLPRSEAFMSQGKTWCSAEHARLGLKK
ncbi:PP0621 family protein [Castellaniella sp. GW247-6E4]|uniref:PP0621 family protein n=1 Tax=Castellaniella sp. GW247-6E4 TaxID=3140380 RepID=UPI0033163533